MPQLNATIVPLQECTLAFAPSFAPCSNNGHCVRDPTLNRSVCVCNDGWSGYSDFGVTTSQTNCQINNDIIRALWAVLLFVSIVGWIIAYPKGRFLYEKHKEKVTKAKSQGRTYRLWHNSGFFSCFSFQIVGFPLLWALCILKLADPNIHVGVHWAPTVLWWCIRFFVYFSTFTMQPALLSSLLRGTSGLETVVLAHRGLSNACFFVIIACQFSSIWSIVADIDPFNPFPGYDSIIIFASGIAASMAASAAQATYIERKVISALNQSMAIAKDDKTKKLKEKLTSMQSAYRATMIMQGTIYAFLAAAPFMWPIHDYFLPISWLALPALNVKSFNSIMVDEEEKKSRAKKQKDKTSKLGGKNTNSASDRPVVAVPGLQSPQNQIMMNEKSTANSSDVPVSTVMHVYGLEENYGALTEQPLEPPKKLSPAEAAKAKSMARISVGNTSEGSTGLSGNNGTFVSSLGETTNPMFDPLKKADDARVEMHVSPAMRILSMLTPRKGKTPTSTSQRQVFFAPDSDDDEDEDGQGDGKKPAEAETRELA